MPEVLILCEYPSLNGGERSMLSTFAGLRAEGFSPVVAAPPDGPLSVEIASRGVESIPFRCREADGTRVSQQWLREALADVLRCRRPALLHANSLAMGRLSGPVAVELAMPSLSHLRDIVKLSRQSVSDLNGHRRLLAVSQAVLDFHAAQGLSLEKLHVLHNGVDLVEFHPRGDATPSGYLHREFELPHDARLIATIGQIGMRKGQDVLLRAVAEIAKHSSNVHWLIVGERNSEKDESRLFERQLHLDSGEGALCGRVHFLGRRDDISRLLGELTLLVHPARQEPLGRVLLEAAATGLAVVATDVGGTREIFPAEAQAARLVPPDDARALAEAIGELLGDEELRRRLGVAARRQVEERFDARKSTVDLARQYQATMQ